MAWPPTLTALKDDMGISVTDTRNDARLQIVLDAAVKVVELLREGDFTWTGTPTAELPVPGKNIELGTIRLASRYHTRRNSPDALINLADLGSARVPSFDPDIEQLLGVGRHRAPFVAG